ncbi:glycosyltransferase family 2 protein [Chitinophaga barathri]|uniref:Glycosyltransferase n=1 Tax=Chitinophaga barathri TaxID=1647451 RepID=A0A3N4M9R7_9BACT|nr:glycosyltransferase family 2 protein [Chitinophaga barathri]RPD40484.1 glycosyltransferase [Chitinophaga barathri]
MSDHKISIVTVVYNGAKTLERTIRSVADQQYSNTEYIVIDGGSTDGTQDIIRNYSHVINYQTSENDKGIYDAMNKSLKIATGDWLLFLGADDYLLQDSISNFVERITDKDALYYGDVYMPGRHILYHGQSSASLLARRNISHQAIFYPRSIYSKKQYTLEYSICADYAYNLEAFRELGASKFIYIPVLVAIFNDRDGTSAKKTDARFDAVHSSLVRKNLGLLVYLQTILLKFSRFFKPK